MRFVFFLIVFSLLFVFGCQDTESPVSTAPSEPLPAQEATETVSTLEARAAASEDAIAKYIELKDTDPAGALTALKEASRILYDGHPKSEAYAELLFEMDSAGVYTLPQALTLNTLLLEIATDKKYPKEIIEHQNEAIADIEADIQALKAEGKDPDEETFKFIFDPTR